MPHASNNQPSFYDLRKDVIKTRNKLNASENPLDILVHSEEYKAKKERCHLFAYRQKVVTNNGKLIRH